MEYLNLISVPAIASIVYLIVELIKKAVNNSEKFNRIIPLVSLAIGVICGVICFYFFSTIIPADNLVIAMVIGGASGLSATGTHQIVKQLKK